MKRLRALVLVAFGMLVTGSLTMYMVQENVNEQSEIVQSPSDKGSLNGSQDLSEESGQDQSNAIGSKPINDLVVHGIPEKTSMPNVIDQGNTIVSLYGNQDQPGTRVHQAINDSVIEGTPLTTSILNVVNQAIAIEGTNLLSSEALISIGENKSTALDLMANMLTTNDLFAATKSSIESKPEDTSKIVNVSVVLYPDFAQRVIDAAGITGEMDPNEALLAALAAGADPNAVSEATAAGGAIDIDGAGLPFDGLGGGGIGSANAVVSGN